MSFRINLDTYRGPLDLLLYLVRKHEVDVADIPITMIANQFSTYLELIEQMDINAVGDFLEMASTLMEIKSRMVLPGPDEDEASIEDPREELVERLLEYKKYKDAASLLDDQSRDAQQRYSRMSDDLPPRKVDVSEQPIHEVEMWDLVSAFGRVLRENQPPPQSNIVYDDTPISTYMKQIQTELSTRGSVAFTEMFHAGMHKSAMIGVFLAILELVRHHSVDAKQDHLYSEIWVVPGESFAEGIDHSQFDAYE